MLGITEVCSYVPSTKINNRLQAESFGETPEFASDRLGADFLPVKDDIHETSDLAVEAVSRLLKRDAVQLKDIDCLVVCTQTPDECGLPHTSAIVHKKLGLHSEVATFDISLGCSGYVYSLNIVRGFMEA
jgi:3-oxoacyl-[acyl-carrier-protein] synthase-3